MHQEHALVPESVRDCGAGFEIRFLVGQVVVVTKSFAGPTKGFVGVIYMAIGTDAAVQMELPRDDVLPNCVDGLHVRRIARQGGDVCHAAVEIAGADGMPDGFGLLQDGPVVLESRAPRAPQVLAPAQVEQRLCERKVAAFAGGAIELAQGELYLFVPGRILDLRGSEAEGPVYEVCASNRDVEKRTLASDLEIGDGGLVHVSDVVELVTAADVAPAGWPHHAVVHLALLVRAVVEAKRTSRI